jgi:hypothetical protein
MYDKNVLQHLERIPSQTQTHRPILTIWATELSNSTYNVQQDEKHLAWTMHMYTITNCVPKEIAKIGVENNPIYTIKNVLQHLDPYKRFSVKP